MISFVLAILLFLLTIPLSTINLGMKVKDTADKVSGKKKSGLKTRLDKMRGKQSDDDGDDKDKKKDKKDKKDSKKSNKYKEAAYTAAKAAIKSALIAMRAVAALLGVLGTFISMFSFLIIGGVVCCAAFVVVLSGGMSGSRRLTNGVATTHTEVVSGGDFIAQLVIEMGKVWVSEYGPGGSVCNSCYQHGHHPNVLHPDSFTGVDIRPDCSGFAIALANYVSVNYGNGDTHGLTDTAAMGSDGEFREWMTSHDWEYLDISDVSQLKPGDMLITKEKGHVEFFIDMNHSFGWGSAKSVCPTDAAWHNNGEGVSYYAGESKFYTHCFRYKKDVEITVDGEGSSDKVDVEGEVGLDPKWEFAEFAKITSGKAMAYKAKSNRKNKTICVNAGHGTNGGTSVKTQCHPDGSPKVTDGTTGKGALTAVAVSTGMEFSDGTSEASANLKVAKYLKDMLLDGGYDVVMIRESDDIQLDNVARSVIANNTCDAHIAIHFNSTKGGHGVFYMSPPSDASYRAMYPVSENWQKHIKFGDALIAGEKSVNEKIEYGGSMEMDLTQLSYSTIPSIDIELGDHDTDLSDTHLKNLAKGLYNGVEEYFK